MDVKWKRAAVSRCLSISALFFPAWSGPHPAPNHKMADIIELGPTYGESPALSAPSVCRLPSKQLGLNAPYVASLCFLGVFILKITGLIEKDGLCCFYKLTAPTYWGVTRPKHLLFHIFNVFFIVEWLKCVYFSLLSPKVYVNSTVTASAVNIYHQTGWNWWFIKENLLKSPNDPCYWL